MRKLPIGNDQPIRWAVTVSGRPFNLEGQDVHVYVVNSRGEIPLRSLKVKGAEVSGVFEGRYQTRLGEHSLILRVNEGRPEMKTASVANVFELVKWSADAGGSDEGDVIITPVLLESELSIGGVSYDDTELRKAIEDLEQKKVSNTDLATINGQRIDEGGNIEIEASEGTLTAEEVSSTEPTAAFPQVLYTAQSLSDAQKSQARENIGVSEAIEEAIAKIPAPESSVFEAVYGETTFAEIVEARNKGKEVLCKYNDRIARIVQVMDNVLIYFEVTIGSDSQRLVCYPSNRWDSLYINNSHKLKTLDNGNVQVTIAGNSAEVATPQYVESLIISALNTEV